MGFSEAVAAAAPLAAILVPGFVLGFGAIWLAVHNGLTDIRKELTDMRKELHTIAEHVARLDGRLHAGTATE